MATLLQIPAPSNVSARTQRVVLSGREYILSFYWNEFEAKWYLDVSTNEGEALILGVKLAMGVNLLRRVTDARRPPGPLFLIDPSGSDVDPGLRDLGKRVQLLYVDP